MIIALVVEDRPSIQPRFIDFQDILLPIRRYRTNIARLSLVCRAWYGLCRPSLYRVVLLLQKIDLIRIADSHSQSPSTLLSPVLSIESIWIVPHGASILNNIRGSPIHSLEALLASGLVRGFANLKELVWESAECATRGRVRPLVPPRVQSALPALLRPLEGVTRLRIRNKTFTSIFQLARITSALAKLHWLELDGVRFETQGVSVFLALGHIGNFPRPKTLYHLDVRRCDNLHIASLLLLFLTDRRAHNQRAETTRQSNLRHTSESVSLPVASLDDAAAICRLVRHLISHYVYDGNVDNYSYDVSTHMRRLYHDQLNSRCEYLFWPCPLHTVIQA